MKSCCKKRANRQWRNLAGMRLFREVSGKKWYDFRCAKCGGSPFDSGQVALVGLGQRRSLSRAPCEASPTWNPSRRRPASLELQERIAIGLEQRYIGGIMLTVDQVVELVKSGHSRFALIHAAAMVLVQADVDQREVDRHLQKARRKGQVMYDREQGWRVVVK